VFGLCRPRRHSLTTQTGNLLNLDQAVIPKIIHYCWLSQDPFPDDIRRCMNTWKEVMPDYKFVCWDTSKFDIQSNEFVSQACSVKKWAFAADYIRLYALYHHGGIYLDSDVIIKKRFDDFLQYDFFSSMEYHHSYTQRHSIGSFIYEDGRSRNPNTPIPGVGIQAAILGSVKGHRFLRDCLDWYRGRHFILSDGSLFNQVIMPSVLAMVAERYGLRYLDRMQMLDEGMHIFPSEVFAGDQREATADSYAIHCCNGSWRDRPSQSGLTAIFRRLQRHARRLLKIR
jgi:hypothetical protein